MPTLHQHQTLGKPPSACLGVDLSIGARASSDRQELESALKIAAHFFAHNHQLQQLQHLQHHQHQQQQQHPQQLQQSFISSRSSHSDFATNYLSQLALAQHAHESAAAAASIQPATAALHAHLLLQSQVSYKV